MTYDELQVVSQMLSFVIFAGMMIGAFIYAFKRSNKKKFEAASRAPLRNDDDLSGS
jgi:cbb3-type cytochrome oxidase subunit 3